MARITGEHLGMTLTLDDLDVENTAFFGHLANGELRLQRCPENGLMRYPPATRCPFSGSAEYDWVPVDARGTLFSYTEVHHAIQPAFRAHLPYMILLVELDIQRGAPTEHDGLRIVGNLATPDGELAPPGMVAQVGIGSRMRMVFKPIGEGIAMLLWTLDEDAEQPEAPWRYPE